MLAQLHLNVSLFGKVGHEHKPVRRFQDEFSTTMVHVRTSVPQCSLSGFMVLWIWG